RAYDSSSTCRNGTFSPERVFISFRSSPRMLPNGMWGKSVWGFFLRSGLVSFSAGDLEYLFKMQSLWRADHVPNCVALQFGDSIINRRDVTGGVIESAVALANDARPIRQLGNITKENDDRAFANLGDAGLKQSLDDAGQAIVVKAFATLDVVMNVEELINVLEILHRERDALVPDIGVFFVA